MKLIQNYSKYKHKLFCISMLISVICFFRPIIVLAYNTNDTVAWDSGNTTSSYNMGSQGPVTYSLPLSISAVSKTFNGWQVNKINVDTSFIGVGKGTNATIHITLYDKNGNQVQSLSSTYTLSNNVYGSSQLNTHVFNLSSYDKAKFDLSQCYFICSGSGTWNFTGSGTPFVGLYIGNIIITDVISAPICDTNLP